MCTGTARADGIRATHSPIVTSTANSDLVVIFQVHLARDLTYKSKFRASMVPLKGIQRVELAALEKVKVNAKDFDSGADGHLAALDSRDQFGRAAVEDLFCGTNTPLGHVEQIGCGRLRNKRQICRLIGATVPAMRGVGDLRRHDLTLALVEVPPVQVQRRSPPTRYQGKG